MLEAGPRWRRGSNDRHSRPTPPSASLTAAEAFSVPGSAARASSHVSSPPRQVSICLECNSSKLRGLKRKWIRCSAQATVLHLKKFIAKKLNLTSFNEVRLTDHARGWGGAGQGGVGGRSVDLSVGLLSGAGRIGLLHHPRRRSDSIQPTFVSSEII